MTRDQIREALRTIEAHPEGVRGVMRDEQIALGRTIVPLGSRTPFAVPAWDWDDCLISYSETHAYIVMVVAARLRRGALTRLVQSIQRAGLTPVICAPIGKQMPMILAKWGWVEHDNNEWMQR